MSDTPDTTELLVIGAGPGGYVSAIRAAQHDVDVTLVDADAIGGTCLNEGCIPSKALIHAADRIHEVGNASEMGIYGDPYVDVSELFEWKDGVVRRLTSGVEGLCRDNGVTLVDGRISFEDSETARLETAGGGAEITFDSAVVATGSRPLALEGFDFGDGPILDSRQILDLSDVPESLAIVGAGYIGMELGTVFQKLGTDVTIVEMAETILPGYGREVADVVARRARTLGIDIRLGETASGWTREGDRVILTTSDGDGSEYRHACEKVLVAIGREPVTDSLNLGNVGIEPGDDGYIPTDSTGETVCADIYAVGDVAGEPMLAHSAAMEGIVAADDIAGEDVTMDGRAIPAVVFTDPEIATVGLSPSAAEREGFEPVVGRFPFAANGRALSRGTVDGFVRLVADAETGTLLGAAIVGPEASELVAEPTLAIQQGLTVRALDSTVHAHPTLSEAVMESAADVFGTPIHWGGSES